MYLNYGSIPKDTVALPILSYKKIRGTAEPVNLKSPTLKKDMEKLGWQMAKTCNENNGIGLAAPQVGVSSQVFIAVEFEKPYIWKFTGKFFMYINPTITVAKNAEYIGMSEGCLSVEGKNLLIMRPREIEVSFWYFDEKGVLKQSIKEKLTGFPSRLYSHEYDHLLGKNIVELHEQQNTKPRRGRPPGKANKVKDPGSKVKPKKPKEKKRQYKKRRGAALITSHRV